MENRGDLKAWGGWGKNLRKQPQRKVPLFQSKTMDKDASLLPDPGSARRMDTSCSLSSQRHPVSTTANWKKEDQVVVKEV